MRTRYPDTTNDNAMITPTPAPALSTFAPRCAALDPYPDVLPDPCAWQSPYVDLATGRPACVSCAVRGRQDHDHDYATADAYGDLPPATLRYVDPLTGGPLPTLTVQHATALRVIGDELDGALRPPTYGLWSCAYTLTTATASVRVSLPGVYGGSDPRAASRAWDAVTDTTPVLVTVSPYIVGRPVEGA